MNHRRLCRNADILQIHAVRKGLHTDGGDAGGYRHLFQPLTARKGIVSHGADILPQHHRVQIVAAPKCIRPDVGDGIGKYHQLHIHIILERSPPDGCHCLGHGHILLFSPVFYQSASLYLKIGSRCCRIRLRYRKLHDYKRRHQHQDA
jgi:hypothetical protein